jgi:protein-disulfide isomerase
MSFILQLRIFAACTICTNSTMFQSIEKKRFSYIGSNIVRIVLFVHGPDSEAAAVAFAVANKVPLGGGSAAIVSAQNAAKDVSRPT